MIRLKTLMGAHPNALALKRGAIASDRVQFDFVDEPVPHEAFKPFVRDLAFDCGELAIVTFFQALAYGKALSLLPVVVSSRFHHGSIGYHAAAGLLAPKDLAGRRAAVRTYAQTTGVWVRGILQNDYGVDIDRVTWVTFDEAHLAEYRDPPNCERAAPGKSLERMLFDDEVAAAIPISLASPFLSDPRVARLIPDPEAAAQAWYAAHRAIPINHMLVVRRALTEDRPDAVREIYRLFAAAKAAAPAPAGLDLTPIGVEATRRGLDLVMDYAVQQRIAPRRFSVDELYADAERILGSAIA